MLRAMPRTPASPVWQLRFVKNRVASAGARTRTFCSRIVCLRLLTPPPPPSARPRHSATACAALAPLLQHRRCDRGAQSRPYRMCSMPAMAAACLCLVTGCSPPLGSGSRRWRPSNRRHGVKASSGRSAATHQLPCIPQREQSQLARGGPPARLHSSRPKRLLAREAAPRLGEAPSSCWSLAAAL